MDSLEVDLGFLKDLMKSYDSCMFYADSEYTIIDHSVSVFSITYKY